MRRIAPMIAAAAALLLAGFAEPPKKEAKEPAGYTQEQFAMLAFLAGRWEGKAPDGTIFYEEYDFPSTTSFRSRRFDKDFTKASYGSTITLQNGQVISRWGDFTWRATELRDGYAGFEKMNAPSDFSWRRVGADKVEVTQQFTGEDGRPQSYVVPLKRIKAK